MGPSNDNGKDDQVTPTYVCVVIKLNNRDLIGSDIYSCFVDSIAPSLVLVRAFFFVPVPV